MKIKTVTKVLSLICLVVSFAMLPPLFIAIYDGSNDAKPFVMSILVGIITCYLLYLYSGKGNINMGIREGVGITGFSWLIASLMGALPYWLSGVVPSISLQIKENVLRWLHKNDGRLQNEINYDRY